MLLSGFLGFRIILFFPKQRCVVCNDQRHGKGIEYDHQNQDEPLDHPVDRIVHGLLDQNGILGGLRRRNLRIKSAGHKFERSDIRRPNLPFERQNLLLRFLLLGKKLTLLGLEFRRTVRTKDGFRFTQGGQFPACIGNLDLKLGNSRIRARPGNLKGLQGGLYVIRLLGPSGRQPGDLKARFGDFLLHEGNALVDGLVPLVQIVPCLLGFRINRGKGRPQGIPFLLSRLIDRGKS